MAWQSLPPNQTLKPQIVPILAPSKGKQDQPDTSTPMTPPNDPNDPIHQELKALATQIRDLSDQIRALIEQLTVLSEEDSQRAVLGLELLKLKRKQRKLRDQIVVKMQQSGKLWKDKGNPHSADAEQETWLYIIRKLDGDDIELYEPEKGSLTTLWNKTYQRKLTELNQKAQQEARRREPHQQDAQTGQWHNPVDKVSVPVPDASLTEALPIEFSEATSPPKAFGFTPDWLESLKALIEADPKGKLKQTSIQGRPEVNVQAISLEIIRRLQRSEGWTLKQLAGQFGLQEGTMNSFWTRACKPALRELGKSIEA